ncbi:unnamed protein product [Ixodes pacificus]
MRTLTLCVCLLFVVLPNTTASVSHAAATDEPSTASTDGSVGTQTTAPAVVEDGTTSIPSTKNEAGTSTIKTKNSSEDEQTTATTETEDDTKTRISAKVKAGEPTTTTEDAGEDKQATESTEADGDMKTTTSAKGEKGASTTTIRDAGEDTQTTVSKDGGDGVKTTELTKGEASEPTTSTREAGEDTQTTSPTDAGDGITTTASTKGVEGTPTTTTRDAGEDTQTTASAEASDGIKTTASTKVEPGAPTTTHRDGGEYTQTTSSTEVGEGVKTTASTKEGADALDTTSAGTKQAAASTVPTTGSIPEGASKDGESSTPTTRSDAEKSTTVSKTDSASAATTPETTTTSTSEAPTSTESTPITDRTTCSEDKTIECRKTPFGKCEVVKGKDQCTCEPPMKLWERRCRLEKTVVVKVTVKVTRKSQTLYSNDDGCPSNEDIEDEIWQILQRKKIPIMEISKIKCEGGEVTMDFKISDDGGNKILENVKEALQNAKPTFGDFTIEGEGIDATLSDQCQNGLSQLGKKLGGLKCERKGNNYVLACDDTRSTLVESVNIADIQVHMCQDKPCSAYCDATQNKRCVREKCVCKHGFVPDNDTCVAACRPNTCKNGGTCQPHSEVQFMCICPSKFKGLFCEEENKELHSAKLNIVIVGVVLSALLLMCFVVSASIISRMKKKNNLLAHDSKDVERRRELHGYDGPYNANSSASKHRDHTSL